MKVKDMEKLVGTDQVVAVAPGTDAYSQDYGRKAVILGVRQPRKVYSGERFDFSGHTARDGVRVRYLETGSRSDEIVGQEAVVGPRQVAGPWEPYAEARAERRAREQAKRDGLENQRQRVGALAASLGGYVQPRRSGFGGPVVGYDVILTLDAAERLAGERVS